VKTGLVLEGGAMRGLFTCGITDVLMENSVSFPGMIGVSAGAAFGCNIKSKQPGRALRYNLRFARDKRYCSIRNLLFTGDIFSREFCWHTVPFELDIFDSRAFAENPMEFHLAVTDVTTGKPVYKKLLHGDEKDIEWMRASSSMPLVSHPVSIDGASYLDGGISDSIPLEYFESIGYERNVVILTQPSDFRKTKMPALPLMKMALGKYPELIHAMENRHLMYNRELEHIKKQVSQGKVFLLQPEKDLGISRTERRPSELKRVYDLGRALALKNLPNLLSWMNNGNQPT
jgi:predicted patatin/cPLA2 family phospholipase